MRNSKLMHFLDLLDPKERKEFSKYVASPIFNERDGLQRLLSVIDSYPPGSEINPHEVYGQIYNGERAFNEASLKTSMSQLLRLLLDFLAYQNYAKDEMIQKRYVLQALNSLGESKHFPAYFDQAQKAASEKSQPSHRRYQEIALLEEVRLGFEMRTHGRSGRLASDLALENLGHSFIIQAYRYQILNENVKSTYQVGTSKSLVESLVDRLDETLQQMPLPVRIYHKVLMAVQNPQDEDQYREAVSQLKRAREQLGMVEVEELYTAVLNCALRRVNAGNLNYLQHVHDLYRQMLRYEVIVERGRISAFNYTNIVNSALRLGHFDWAEEFIGEWQHRIHKGHGKAAFQYNLGLLNFHRKKFQEAERHFNRVLDDARDVFFTLNARGYLLQVHYETRNMLALESLAHSTRMMLRRNKGIAKNRRDLYMDFIRCLTRLIAIPPGRKDKLQKLYREIEGREVKGMGYEWLRKQILAMMGEESMAKQGFD